MRMIEVGMSKGDEMGWVWVGWRGVMTGICCGAGVTLDSGRDVVEGMGLGFDRYACMRLW